jgi:hypothetical protein
MISNIPTFTQDQDFQARHADMLAAARGKIFPKAGALLWTVWRPLPIRWDDESLTAQQRVEAFLTDR